LIIGNDTGYVDEHVRELTFAKRLYKHFLWDKVGVGLQVETLKGVVEKKDGNIKRIIKDTLTDLCGNMQNDFIKSFFEIKLACGCRSRR
jgi:ribosomal protein S3AE